MAGKYTTKELSSEYIEEHGDVEVVLDPNGAGAPEFAEARELRCVWSSPN